MFSVDTFTLSSTYDTTRGIAYYFTANFEESFIIKVDPATGDITTLAGGSYLEEDIESGDSVPINRDGVGTEARFSFNGVRLRYDKGE